MLLCATTASELIDPEYGFCVPLLLARVAAMVRECEAIYGLFRLGECALVAWGCGVIAGLKRVVLDENFLLALLCDSTPASK